MGGQAAVAVQLLAQPGTQGPRRHDGDGAIDIDELNKYVYRNVTPHGPGPLPAAADASADRPVGHAGRPRGGPAASAEPATRCWPTWPSNWRTSMARPAARQGRRAGVHLDRRAGRAARRQLRPARPLVRRGAGAKADRPGRGQVQRGRPQPAPDRPWSARKFSGQGPGSGEALKELSRPGRADCPRWRRGRSAAGPAGW